MPKYPSHILELAKRGAEHRFQELQGELALLVKQFPHLRRGKNAHRLGSPADAVKTPIRRRRRAKWSAAAKQAVSARMKKYWAKRKAAVRKG